MARPIFIVSSSISVAFVSIVKLLGVPFMLMFIVPGVRGSVRVILICHLFLAVWVFVFRPLFLAYVFWIAWARSLRLMLWFCHCFCI